MSWVPLLLLLFPTVDASQVLEVPEPTVRPAFSFGIRGEVATTYVYRGEPQYATTTVPSFQPSFWLEMGPLGPGGLTLEVWSAVALSRREETSLDGAASEIDLSLAYHAVVASEWLNVTGGFRYCTYPGEEEPDGEKELFAALSANLPLIPSLEVWAEVHPSVALYLEPALGWEQQMERVRIGADISFGATFERDMDPRMDHTTVTIHIYHTMDRLTLGTSLSYVVRLRPGLGNTITERSVLFGNIFLEFESQP